MIKLTIIFTIFFISCCLAVPQKKDDNLSGLITEIFGTPPPQVVSTTQNIDQTIHQIFPGPNNDPNANRGPGTNDDDCECVPYYQCKNGTIIQDGIGLIDIRINSRSGPCTDYLEVCCKAPYRINPDPTPLPPKNTRGCGIRNSEGVGFRITGHKDNEAQFGEFPWMVAVLKEEQIGTNPEPLNVYQCGGALIHPKVVLTAAHCVNGKTPSMLKIRAGEWDTQTKSEIYPHQDRNVENIIVHERFHAGALYNDVALLFLASPVEITQNVDVVCLPEHNSIFDGSRCFASGWGKNIFGKEGHYQVILKRVELPIVPQNICQNTLRATRLGHFFVLDSSFLCAGGEAGRDTCQGDGGSPLMCPLRHDPARYVQAGIVAWGIGCGENLVPGVYANVAHVRPWIDQQLSYHNLDNSVYRYSN